MAKRYRTNEVLKLVDISRNTLYNWFKKKRVKEVAKDRNGCRVFTDADLTRIRTYRDKIILPPE